MDCTNIRLDRYSGEPLHIQLAGQLRRCILDTGSCRISRLPSERSLCEKLNLNRSTVHRAYETLLNDGIVTSCPNRQLAVAPQATTRSTLPCLIFSTIFFCSVFV